VRDWVCTVRRFVGLSGCELMIVNPVDPLVIMTVFQRHDSNHAVRDRQHSAHSRAVITKTEGSHH
jgi:hypothetical protein